MIASTWTRPAAAGETSPPAATKSGQRFFHSPAAETTPTACNCEVEQCARFDERVTLTGRLTTASMLFDVDKVEDPARYR